jgi:hypothetical protein
MFPTFLFLPQSIAWNCVVILNKCREFCSNLCHHAKTLEWLQYFASINLRDSSLGQAPPLLHRPLENVGRARIEVPHPWNRLNSRFLPLQSPPLTPVPDPAHVPVWQEPVHEQDCGQLVAQLTKLPLPLHGFVDAIWLCNLCVPEGFNLLHSSSAWSMGNRW